MRDSMHRHCAAIAQAPLVVNDQPEIDALYMVVTGLFKGLVGKVYGQIKKLFAGVFVHVLILRELSNWRHSYFPKVVETIFFSMPVTNTDKRFYQ